jgi:hypothetical protein
MKTLTLSDIALEQLAQMLRDCPISHCPILLVEVMNQTPTLLMDSNNQQEQRTCLSSHDGRTKPSGSERT